MVAWHPGQHPPLIVSQPTFTPVRRPSVLFRSSAVRPFGTVRHRGTFMNAKLTLVLLTAILLSTVAPAPAQELGGAGTLQGTVTDPTGAVMTSVAVSIVNPVSGLRRDTSTDEMGRFIFRNLPPNPYHLEIGRASC